MPSTLNGQPTWKRQSLPAVKVQPGKGDYFGREWEVPILLYGRPAFVVRQDADGEASVWLARAELMIARGLLLHGAVRYAEHLAQHSEWLSHSDARKLVWNPFAGQAILAEMCGPSAQFVYFGSIEARPQ